VNTFTRIVANSLAALVLSAFSWSAHAAYTWDLSYLLPGSTGNYGTVATVSLAQGTGGVDITVDNTMSLSGAFLTRLWLSYAGDTSGFSNASLTNVAAVGPEKMSVGNGPQGYDGLNLEFDFSTNPPRFYESTPAVTFTLLGANLNDFGTLVSSPNGPDSPVMVMLQAPGGLSFHYVSAAPEPNTYLLMATGLGLMGVLVRRRMNG